MPKSNQMPVVDSQGSQSGSAIIYVLLGLVVATAIVFGALDHVMIMNRAIGLFHKRSARTTSFEQIVQLVGIEGSLEDSVELGKGNPPATVPSQLWTCINGGPAGATCTTNCCKGEKTATGISNFSDLTLVDPMDTTLTLENKGILAGPASKPAYYTASGKPCNPTDANAVCTYSISGKFSARCPGNVELCDHAEHLHIFLELKPTGKDLMVKAQTRDIYYFVNKNYQPFVKLPPAMQTIQLGVKPDLALTIQGDAGHPSEIDNLQFKKCHIADTSVVAFNDATAGGLGCGVFSGNQATINLVGKTPGQETTLTYSVTDNKDEHSESDTYTVKIKVVP
jgi:hypothetical protein